MSILLTDVQDRVGTITLNRPERRNALDGPLVAALDAAVKQMAADDQVRVVILTGTGPDGTVGAGFCSGGDTKRKAAPNDGMELGVPPEPLTGDLARHDLHAAMLLHTMSKPTIAAIGGPAVGAGCSLAAACDLRYMATDAVLSAGFTANGLSGDYGGTFLWTRIAGTAVTRRMYLLNEKLTATEAAQLGLVHEVAEPEGLMDVVRSTAQRLARMPADLLALVKANLNEAEDSPERRRQLFAMETQNQITSGKLIMRRMARAAERQAEASN